MERTSRRIIMNRFLSILENAPTYKCVTEENNQIFIEAGISRKFWINKNSLEYQYQKLFVQQIKEIISSEKIQNKTEPIKNHEKKFNKKLSKIKFSKEKSINLVKGIKF